MRHTILPSCLILALAGLAVPTSAGGLELESCHLPGLRQEARCGTFSVPENRGVPENRALSDGRTIEIHFAVIPAVDETSEPDPVVLFAGGPGQAGTDMAPFVRAVFSEVNESRDLVLVDQRGMGDSHPLTCDLPDDEPWSIGPEERDRLTREVLAKCLETLDADVTLYTQDRANQDVHELLLALGYDKVNLYGVSWGTRSALLYAHRYGEHVRTMILDGALPLDNPAPLHAAADGERALLALIDSCKSDPACAEAFPDLRRDFDTLMERLGADGREITLPEPSTGETITVRLTRDLAGDLVRSVLYSAELSRLLPVMIHQAAQGDYRALMGVSSFVVGSSADTMTIGASLTIFCSEEMARIEPADFEREAGPHLLGRQILHNLEVACEVWPKAPLPEIYREAPSPSVPTLVLSGEADPITPPRWGERMAETLPDAVHLVAPATGHNVAPMGCAGTLIAQVIDAGNVRELDAACLQEITRPSFFVDTSGPRQVAEKGPEDTTTEDEGASDD